MTFKLANRRSFLSMLSASGAALLGSRRGWADPPPARNRSEGRGYAGWPNGDPNAPVAITGFGATGDVFAELGLTPIINASGTLTVIGGSLMPPEVEAVMRMGSNHFVPLDALERAAGHKIASMLKLPAGYSALVTSGAAAAIMVGWAGVLTGDNPEYIKQIPDLSGMPKSEIIIQKSHREAFDHQIRQTGVKLVVVNSRAELLAAINPRTAGLHFLNHANASGAVQREEYVRIAHAHNLPCYCDAAADTPPVSRLWEYANLGFDLVGFSGGKDIRGPQCAGLLLGRQQLLDYSLLNMSPQEDTIGRPCKVGKEEIYGMIKALELFLASDQAALLQSYYSRLGVVAAAAERFPGVTTSYSYSEAQIMNETPRLSISWDPAKIRLSSQQVVEQMSASHPSAIRLGGSRRGAARPGIGLSCWQLKPGEEAIIARRLSQIFGAGVA